MRRELIPFHDISDMTMSVMRQKQDEACFQRLFAHPSVSLFDPSLTDGDVFPLLTNSFPSFLNPYTTKLAQLRKAVIKSVQLEAKYLSEGEIILLEALLLQDGEIFLEEWDDPSSVEALLKRLWCTVVKEENDLVIHLPWELQKPIATVFAQKKTEKIREKLEGLTVMVRTILYRLGFVSAGGVLQYIMDRIMRDKTEFARLAALRFLMASFEYETDASGVPLLLHPGLSSAGMIIQNRLNMNIDPEGNQDEYDYNDYFLETHGLYQQEIPLMEGMIGVLNGALRPEYNPIDAARDLLMLIKQGASMEELTRLLSSMLAVLPTPLIRERLRLLYEGTPRWAGLETPVLN